MHRPLRVPFYLRVWHLVRGLLFYNTVYWRRASDGLNMPSLSAEERERQRPERNLEIIRPRTRPRAHVEVARGGEISNPPVALTTETPPDEPLEEQPVVDEHAAHRSSRSEDHRDDDGQIYVKRRRYRRRLASRGSAAERGGFFARVFGRK